MFFFGSDPDQTKLLDLDTNSSQSGSTALVTQY
jgi:hypothetical protein